MIFDAGVFIALENESQRRVVVALVDQLLSESAPPLTTEAVLAQAWRDPARQVAMSRLVKATVSYPLSDPKLIGVRCKEAGTSDIVDADLSVWGEVLDDVIVTTDPIDMADLGARHVAL